jgi:hypothetical protein
MVQFGYIDFIGGLVMYYRLEQIIKLIKSIALNLQGRNYWFIMIPTLLISGISLFMNKGFPPEQELDMFFNYRDNPQNFFIDTAAGILCIFMIIPTSYSWWKLREEYYFYIHIPVLLFVGLLFISGFLFASALFFILMLLLILFILVWIWAKIR